MTDHPNTQPLLEARGLFKYYPDGQVRALNGVSLRVPRGDYLAIMGPSGCGKSTLLHLLGALDAPTSGQVNFDGQDLARLSHPAGFRAREIGFVFQSFYLIPSLTAVENVQMPMFDGPPRSGRERRRRAEQLLEVVGLSRRARHLPKRLSVGERQRVALARALANGPRLLLADEPTGNLDSVSAAEIFALFRRLRDEQGLTIVLVTHDQRLADEASRVVHLRDGQLEREVPRLVPRLLAA